MHTRDAVHHWQDMEHTRAAKFNWYGRRFVLTREIHQHDKLGYVPEDEDQGGEVQDEEEHIYEGGEAPKTGGELQGGEVAPATSKPSTEKKKKKGKKRGKKAAEEEHKHEPTEKELAQVKATQMTSTKPTTTGTTSITSRTIPPPRTSSCTTSFWSFTAAP